MMTWKDEQKAISEAIAQFPATFSLRLDSPISKRDKHSFRISPSASYVNDSGVVILYTEILIDGNWLEYAKGTAAELQIWIIADPNLPPVRESSVESAESVQDAPASPVMRLMYFPVNAAWAFIFGSDIQSANLCQLYSFPMFFQTKGDAIEAAKHRGLNVDPRTGGVSAQG